MNEELMGVLFVCEDDVAINGVAITGDITNDIVADLKSRTNAALASVDESEVPVAATTHILTVSDGDDTMVVLLSFQENLLIVLGTICSSKYDWVDGMGEFDWVYEIRAVFGRIHMAVPDREDVLRIMNPRTHGYEVELIGVPDVVGGPAGIDVYLVKG